MKETFALTGTFPFDVAVDDVVEIFVFVLATSLPSSLFLVRLSILPPAADGDEQDVDDVESDHEERLPEVDVLVVQDTQREGDGDGEEADVAEERPPLHSERCDERHGATGRERTVSQCMRVEWVRGVAPLTRRPK